MKAILAISIILILLTSSGSLYFSINALQTIRKEGSNIVTAVQSLPGSQKNNRTDALTAEQIIQSRTITLINGIYYDESKRVSELLLAIDANESGPEIDLYIDTGGGQTGYAFTIIDTFHMIDSPVNVHVIGRCRSAGAMILVGATGKKTSAPYAAIAPHFNLPTAEHPYTEHHHNLQRFQRLWKENTNLPKNWYPVTLDAGDRMWYLTPEQALEYSIIDEIRKQQFEQGSGGNG